MKRSTGRLLEAADGADRLGARALRLEGSQVADEVAHLLLAKQEALDVLRLALERGLIDVDDREVRVREPLGGRGDGISLGEPDADHQVVALPRQCRHVRDVIRRALRLDDPALDPELALRALEALVGELVEAVVVQLARVGHERDLEARGRRRGRRVGLGRGTARLVVAATPGGQRDGGHGEGRDGEEAVERSCHRCRSWFPLVFDYES